MTTDRASASILVLFALLVIWESRHLPLGTFRQPGPAYVPVLLASLLLIFGVLLIFTAGACTLTIITPLDGVAPCLGDFGRVRLRCLCH